MSDANISLREPLARTLLVQLRRNFLAVISLVVALSALSYNTYRNELSETNRNVRAAGFIMLQELAELQLIADYAHYDKDTTNGNPIAGWGRLLYMRDISELVNAEVVAQTALLTEVWGRQWSKFGKHEDSNKRVTAAIDEVRNKVRLAIAKLE